MRNNQKENKTHGHTFPSGIACLSIEHRWTKYAAGTQCPVCEVLSRESALRAQVKELEAGLKTYGQHHLWCRRVYRENPGDLIDPKEICNCGLKEAIACEVKK